MEVHAHPYRFPFDGIARDPVIALVLLGFDRMQVAATGQAGRSALANASRILAGFLATGRPVVFGRRGVDTLDDLPPAVRHRNARRADDRILALSDPGAEPAMDTTGVPVVDHPADNAFIASGMAHLLARARADALIVCGLRTEGSVHATMREANDRGFECLLVSDACASADASFHATILSLTAFGNGLFGCVGATADVLRGLERSA